MYTLYFTVCKLYLDFLKWEEKKNHLKAVLENQAGSSFQSTKIEMICGRYKANVIRFHERAKAPIAPKRQRVSPKKANSRITSSSETAETGRRYWYDGELVIYS